MYQVAKFGDQNNKIKKSILIIFSSGMAVSGAFHNITLSGDNVAHSWGQNRLGQLGLGHNDNVSVPSPISTLPQIKQIACGSNYTVCVDFEGFLWSFGQNTYGQLGTGNYSHSNVPLKIQGIPPVHSVACGTSHTLIITNSSELLSCGNNLEGQLCLSKIGHHPRFQPTQFSNISMVSLGLHYSLFQNEQGEIYSCGSNNFGELGLGSNIHPQIAPTLIPNLPPNIVQFVCGVSHTLFLDLEGNVFSAGANQYGQLGIGNFIHQNVLNQIQNIPPIRTISCVGYSSFLIDFEGNLWSFGNNQNGQLGW